MNEIRTCNLRYSKYKSISLKMISINPVFSFHERLHNFFDPFAYSDHYDDNRQKISQRLKLFFSRSNILMIEKRAYLIPFIYCDEVHIKLEIPSVHVRLWQITGPHLTQTFSKGLKMEHGFRLNLGKRSKIIIFDSFLTIF